MSAVADVRDPITALNVMGRGHSRETLRDWLEASSDHDPDREGSPDEDSPPPPNPLARLSAGARKEAARQVAAAVDAELDGINIGDLLVKGWTSYDELLTAGRETAEAPGIRQVLDMASHSMDWTGRFSVRVSVDGVPVESADVLVELHLVVQALVATVTAGRLVAIGAGTAVTTVTVTVGAFHVTSDPVTFPLERLTTVSLGSKGIALVPLESVRAGTRRTAVDGPEHATDSVVP
jgi:hypothetical protein